MEETGLHGAGFEQAQWVRQRDRPANPEFAGGHDFRAAIRQMNEVRIALRVSRRIDPADDPAFLVEPPRPLLRWQPGRPVSPARCGEGHLRTYRRIKEDDVPEAGS